MLQKYVILSHKYAKNEREKVEDIVENVLFSLYCLSSNIICYLLSKSCFDTRSVQMNVSFELVT